MLFMSVPSFCSQARLLEHWQVRNLGKYGYVKRSIVGALSTHWRYSPVS